MSALATIGDVKPSFLDAVQINNIKLDLIQLVATTNQQFADAIAEVDQATTEVIEIGNESAQFNTYLTELGTYANSANLAWLNVLGFGASFPPTDTSGGGGWDTNARTLTIPATKTGAGAAYIITFSLSGNASLKQGDTIKLRFVLTQSVTGVVPQVDFSLTADGANVPLGVPTSRAIDADNKVFEYIFPYQITSLTASLVAQISIKSTAPAQPVSATLRWDSLTYFPDKEKFIQGLKAINDIVLSLQALFPVLELPYIIVSLNGGGTVDVSAGLASYIAQAIAKKKRLEFTKDASYFIGTPVDITAEVELSGNWCSFRANTAEVFAMKTTGKVIMRKMKFTAATLTGTSFKFYSVSDGSEFSDFKFLTIKDAFFLDNVKNFRGINFSWLNGEKGLIMGGSGAGGASNINGAYFENPIFDTVSKEPFSYAGGSNVTLVNPVFSRMSGGGVQPERAIMMSVAVGNHSNVCIINPTIEFANQYSVRLGVGAVASLENFRIQGGMIKDLSGVVSAVGMNITVTSGGALLGFSVVGTQMITRGATAIIINGASYVNLSGVTIRKLGGLAANNSQGMNITNSSIMRAGVAVIGCDVPDNIPTSGVGANIILDPH